MSRDTLTCDEHVGGQTLSAWRDALLPDDEMRRVEAHAASCPACRQMLDEFEGVARALHRQVELEPDARILAEVRLRVAERRRLRVLRMPRLRLWSGLGALGSVAALLVLFVYVFNTLPGPHPPHPAGTAQVAYTASVFADTGVATAIPPATVAASAPSGTFSVADPAVAHQLSFAYVQDNDVWVSYRGAPPRQVTRFSLTDANLTWRLYWTPDQSRLLADETPEQYPFTPARAWIIAMPSGVVSPLPSSIAQACGSGVSCVWLLDRYIVHVNLAQFGTHAQGYQVYDIQTQHDLVTSLDKQDITELAVRGSAVYYTAYGGSDGQRNIQRYDLSTNTSTTAFTTPGDLIVEGIASGNWDLSTNAHAVVSNFAQNATLHCPTDACHTYYQDTSGTVAAILIGVNGVDRLTISPDGMHAATTVVASQATILQPASGYSIVQQGLPSGARISNALPQAAGTQYWILGWTPDSSEILIQQAQVDRQGNTHPTAIYAAAAGLAAAAQLVEALPATEALAVAPMAG